MAAYGIVTNIGVSGYLVSTTFSLRGDSQPLISRQENREIKHSEVIVSHLPGKESSRLDFHLHPGENLLLALAGKLKKGNVFGGKEDIPLQCVAPGLSQFCSSHDPGLAVKHLLQCQRPRMQGRSKNIYLCIKLVVEKVKA